MKVIVFNTQLYELPFLKGALHNHEVNYVEEPLSIESAANIDNTYAISISGEALDKPMLNKLVEKGVKHVALRIAGLDRIDTRYASKVGITIAHVPDYSPFAVAEHAMMLLLALNRKLLRANTKVREYDFTLNDLVGTDLHGKTAGIVGLGRTGQAMASILNGFGCRILGYNRSEKPDLTEKYQVEFCTLEKLCKESDFISLHLPYNKHTHYIINKKTIALMKKGVLLVNTARGQLVNIQDAIDEIVNEHIGGLGLDVYENEIGLFFQDHSNAILKDETFARLLSFKNVIITGHMAFLTREALSNIAQTTAFTLDCWEKGVTSKYEVKI
ncbi:NAD(P)-dependent oxidoreductase [Cytophagaceae bacterium ABcell3]|nr:NAD(P)-dependent oxidoreductase [Cytophagaceae bacterium ABcell3]